MIGLSEDDGQLRQDEFRYWCFISYRHVDNSVEDRAWASWLHQEIERYDVPAELVGKTNNRGDVIPERLHPVFRDEESLAANADLASSIRAALDRSRYLVVIASPRAVASRYVAAEIEHFRSSGKADQVVAAIVDGEPGHPSRDCFPTPLLQAAGMDGKLDPSSKIEPIGADFRLPDGSEGYTSAEAYRRVLLRTRGRDTAKRLSEAYALRLRQMTLKVIAGILGVPLDLLLKRDEAHQLALQRQRTKVLHRWLAVVGLLAIVAVGLGLRANQQTLAALDASFAAEIALARGALRGGDAPTMREALLRSDNAALERGSNLFASRDAAAVAERIASDRALTGGLLHYIREPEGVVDASFSGDAARIATLSGQGRLRLWRAADGQLLAEAPRRQAGDRLVLDAKGDRVFVAAANALAAQEAAPVGVFVWRVNDRTLDSLLEEGASREENAVINGVGAFAASPSGSEVFVSFGHLGSYQVRSSSLDKSFTDTDGVVTSIRPIRGVFLSAQFRVSDEGDAWILGPANGIGPDSDFRVLSALDGTVKAIAASGDLIRLDGVAALPAASRLSSLGLNSLIWLGGPFFARQVDDLQNLFAVYQGQDGQRIGSLFAGAASRLVASRDGSRVAAVYAREVGIFEPLAHEGPISPGGDALRADPASSDTDAIQSDKIKFSIVPENAEPSLPSVPLDFDLLTDGGERFEPRRAARMGSNRFVVVDRLNMLVFERTPTRKIASITASSGSIAVATDYIFRTSSEGVFPHSGISDTCVAAELERSNWALVIWRIEEKLTPDLVEYAADPDAGRLEDISLARDCGSAAAVDVSGQIRLYRLARRAGSPGADMTREDGGQFVKGARIARILGIDTMAILSKGWPIALADGRVGSLIAGYFIGRPSQQDGKRGSGMNFQLLEENTALSFARNSP